MENALKGLTMAAGIVITCIIIGLGFYLLREAESTAKEAGEKMIKLRVEMEESGVNQYDGMEITGAELMNIIRKNEITVKVTDNSGTYLYSDSTYIRELQDPESSRYIYPLSIYTGKVIYDSNKVITAVEFIKK